MCVCGVAHWVGWRQLLEEGEETGRQMWWKTELAPWLQFPDDFLHVSVIIQAEAQEGGRTCGFIPGGHGDSNSGLGLPTENAFPGVCQQHHWESWGGLMWLTARIQPQLWAGMLVWGHQQGLQPVGESD